MSELFEEGTKLVSEISSIQYTTDEFLETRAKHLFILIQLAQVCRESNKSGNLRQAKDVEETFMKEAKVFVKEIITAALMDSNMNLARVELTRVVNSLKPRKKIFRLF